MFIEKHNGPVSSCDGIRARLEEKSDLRGPGSGLAARPGRSLRNRFGFCCPIHWHHTALGSGTGKRLKVALSVIHGYGSIPINTIFRGMNIHLPAILM